MAIDWLPIEEATQDGTDLLLKTNDRDYSIATYDENKKKWVALADGMYCCDGDGDTIYVISPTHFAYID